MADPLKAERFGFFEKAVIKDPITGEDCDRPLCSISITNGTQVIEEVYLLRHPDVMRMPTVRDWVDEYLYDCEFKPNIRLSERPPVWQPMRKIFDYYYKEFCECQKP